MKKYIYNVVIFLTPFLINAQALITTNPSLGIVPDPSSVLQISDNNKGILLPRIPLLNSTDQITVPTPVNGVLVYNTNTEKYNFWQNGAWNRNFETQDAVDIIQITNNFTGSSNNITTISGFPATMPLYTIDSDTTGWTSLGTSTTITITKPNNTNYIIAEGMSQINNTDETGKEYQFAIGIFVNGQLKIVRKYYTFGGEFTCNWMKFSASGVFYNLPVGTHTVQVYAANLPRVGSTSGFNSISYGGPNGTCGNINQDMARIYITSQVTQ